MRSEPSLIPSDPPFPSVADPLLQSVTDPQWVQVALQDLDAVYSDHLHCERKAAQSALSLVRNYPQQTDLVRDVSRLAHEETSHVIAVMQLLAKQGKTLRYDLGDDYAKQLRAHIRKKEPGRLLDSLLVFALIEARSAERLALLASAIPDPQTASLYKSLASAEVRHRDLFLKLAQSSVPESDYIARRNELAEKEAAVIASLPVRARIH